MHKRLTFIIKPTDLCNCSCKYCITPYDIPKVKMSIETFTTLCKKLSNNTLYDDYLFIWHGGEPMLMGVDYYKQALNIEKKYLKSYNNTFQSNCTLLNDEWFEFLSANKIRVSTSLDGNQRYHDVNRLKDGKGTFDIVFSNITKLQELKLLAGVVTVLSKTNIEHLDEILQFFAGNKISTRLNPILPSDRVLDSEDDLSITPNEYADCLIKCFDNWVNESYSGGDKINIAPFSEIVYNMFHTEKPRLCVYSGRCYENFIAINPYGDLYNCGRFCDILQYKIANINDDFNWHDLFEKKQQLMQWSRNDETNDCMHCEWKHLCNSGCPHSSYIYNGRIIGKDPYCEANKKLFSHIYTVLKEQLNK